MVHFGPGSEELGVLWRGPLPRCEMTQANGTSVKLLGEILLNFSSHAWTSLKLGLVKGAVNIRHIQPLCRTDDRSYRTISGFSGRNPCILDELFVEDLMKHLA